MVTKTKNYSNSSSFEYQCFINTNLSRFQILEAQNVTPDKLTHIKYKTINSYENSLEQPNLTISITVKVTIYKN